MKAAIASTIEASQSHRFGYTLERERLAWYID
jgi:hypothetical protein